jgi:adenylate cyclase
LELAAQQSLRNYSNREAIQHINKAFELTRQVTSNVDAQKSSAWEVILADAYHELSDYGEASTHYARAMRLLSQRLPNNKTERTIGLLGHAARHIKSRLVRSHPETLPAKTRVSFQTAAHIYERLSEEYFFLNDSLALLHGTLASINFAERAGSKAEIVNGFNALALGLAMSGLVSAAHFYSRRALQLAAEHGKLPDLARAELVAGVVAYGLAKWDLVDRCLERAMELNKTLGDRARWQAARTISIFVAILRGAVRQAENSLHDLDTTISNDTSAQIKAWTLSLRVLIGTIRGNIKISDLKELRALAASKLALADQLLCLGVVASAYMQRQEIAPALEAAESGLSVLKESKVIWGGYVYGAAGVADALLARCALAAADGQLIETRDLENARTACRLMSQVARTSPVCRPFSLLIRGRMSLLSGRKMQALRAWQAAASVAERLQMPRERGLALYEIGRAMATSDPNRRSSLALAAEIFEEFEISADLKMVQQALSG